MTQAQQITLEELLGQLSRIQAEWLDEDGEKVLAAIPSVIDRIGTSPVDRPIIEDILRREPYALDVFRLFLDVSQDILSNEMRARGITGGFDSLRRKCRTNTSQIAVVLEELGIVDAIETHKAHEWTLQDVLWDRYGHMRGRAMTAQNRGAALEDAVEVILKELQNECVIPAYIRGGNFINRSGREAKADFMIPSRNVPRIIIEAKGYEATGSKLTDVLGDILKVEIKDAETHYFFVTDGIGWYRRQSDLQKIIESHMQGHIDMIYTMKTLPKLKDAIRELVVGKAR
jgi:hypothetical protein